MEDIRYANDVQLPKEKHECKYGRKSILFQTLPYVFTIRRSSKLSNIFYYASFAVDNFKYIFSQQVWVGNHKASAKIIWQTFLDVNNDYFTVERSTDAINYFPIINIPSEDSSSFKNNYYSYIDSTLKWNQVYSYRVKQTNFSGHSSYSDTVYFVLD